MAEAEAQFRNVEGYRGLANLANAVERDLTRRRNAVIKELTTSLTV